MDNPAKFVEESARLTRIFGEWPSFHDAEVIDFHLWRGEVEPARNLYIFPVVTVKFHLWELTSEVDANGRLISRHHTLAVLRFHDVQDLRLADFNHQNAILGLKILPEKLVAGHPSGFWVQLWPAHGIDATFRCTRVEVVSAELTASQSRSRTES